jgi:hypothetical protein
MFLQNKIAVPEIPKEQDKKIELIRNVSKNKIQNNT